MKTAILMSTYNGEKYLCEQIDSILSQKNIDIRLFIRDDGSSDKTIEIIKQYAKENDNVCIYCGENIGVGNSFMQLVYDVGTKFDYYAFADQDDIWLSSKIEKAIEHLSKKQDPICYCSNQILVDSNGEKIGERHESSIDTSYKQILCNNRITGCTMVWNRALQNIISDERYRPSAELLRKRIHDVWVAMIASVVGTIYYDNQSWIYYRQHEGNVVGVKNESIMKLWKKKINNPALRRGRSSLAKEIVNKFGNDLINKNIYEQLYCYAHYRDSTRGMIKLLRNKELCEYSCESIISYKIKVLLGLF